MQLRWDEETRWSVISIFLLCFGFLDNPLLLLFIFCGGKMSERQKWMIYTAKIKNKWKKIRKIKNKIKKYKAKIKLKTEKK